MSADGLGRGRCENGAGSGGSRGRTARSCRGVARAADRLRLSAERGL